MLDETTQDTNECRQHVSILTFNAECCEPALAFPGPNQSNHSMVENPFAFPECITPLRAFYH